MDTKKYQILILDSSIAMRKGLRALLTPVEADFFEAANGRDLWMLNRSAPRLLASLGSLQPGPASEMFVE